MAAYQYRLQLARIADAPYLAAMARTCVEEGLRPKWDAARIAWHVRDPDSVVLTARTPVSVAGFAIMRYADELAHLNLLTVAPVHRRRGLARRLMTWLEETALTAGTFVIGLELRAGNEVARAFYRSLGYSELGSVPGYYQGLESAIRMSRDVRVSGTRAPDVPPQSP